MVAFIDRHREVYGVEPILARCCRWAPRPTTSTKLDGLIPAERLHGRGGIGNWKGRSGVCRRRTSSSTGCARRGASSIAKTSRWPAVP